MEICRICEALTGVNSDTEYNQKLLESENFVVIPALGPLVKGHTMIVTKAHVLNMKKVIPALKGEYEQLITKISRCFCLHEDELLIYEHGSSLGGRGKGCIAHAHFNVLPGHSGISNSIINNFKKHGVSIITGSNDDCPYIYFRDKSKETFFAVDRLPPQFLRMLIGEHLGIKKWSWLDCIE